MRKSEKKREKHINIMKKVCVGA